MKLAIISDTHFGDDNCTLVTPDGQTGPKYGAFKNAVGTNNDFLILVGDIFDFSIAPYEKAYGAGKIFFDQIQRDQIAQQVIYLAGNHDADIWHIVQHQRNVINMLQMGKTPATYEHSIAGIIDDRAGSPSGGFTLDKTTSKKAAAGDPKYGGMFLDKITFPDTIFNFAYPNLYIVTDRETVLVTHGQYMESYWSLLGEIAMKVAYDDLKVGEMDIEEMIELNFPLNQLACTGLGQAGVLTKVVRMVECDVKNKQFARIERYLDRLEKEIDELTDYAWIKELVVDYLLKKVKEEMLSSIENIEQTRYCEEFIHKKEVRERFKRFYLSSLLEIGDINGRSGMNIPAPWRVIFGHTHQPIAWDDPDAPKFDTVSSASPRRLTLHNTGGWLMENNNFCGAEIFLYGTAAGFSSVSIK